MFEIRKDFKLLGEGEGLGEAEPEPRELDPEPREVVVVSGARLLSKQPVKKNAHHKLNPDSGSKRGGFMERLRLREVGFFIIIGIFQKKSVFLKS